MFFLINNFLKNNAYSFSEGQEIDIFFLID